MSNQSQHMPSPETLVMESHDGKEKTSDIGTKQYCKPLSSFPVQSGQSIIFSYLWLVSRLLACSRLWFDRYTPLASSQKLKWLHAARLCCVTSGCTHEINPHIDRYMTFYFLFNLLWIVQVSIELCSSQWKSPSIVVKTATLKSSHFGKRPYAWNQIRTTFSGPSVSKILKVGSQGPQVMILDHFSQSIKCMGLKF